VVRVPRFLPHALVVAFAIWCAFALRGDLAQLPLAAVVRSWDLVVLAVALSLLNYALRIVRWRYYLARLGHAFPLHFAAITFIAGFAYTLSPGKVGEMVRARYYIPVGVSLSKVAAAFFAERLMDLVAMVVLAALLFVGSARYRSATLAAAAAVGMALAVFALTPWTSVKEALSRSARVPQILRPALLSLSSALASTRPLLRARPLALGFAVAMLAWGLEGIGLGVLSSIVPAIHLDPAHAVGIYAVAVLIGALSFLPGGLGSTEAVMTTLLVTSGYSVADAVLVTLMCRLVTLWLGVCIGWLAVLFLRQRAASAVLPWQ
jgi:uncharacterized protein (TIRG00374 family)